MLRSRARRPRPSYRATRRRPTAIQDSEASLAIKSAVLAGPTITSLVGYTFSFNTLDNNKSPTSGLYAELRQDFAGVGGDVNFIKTTADWRYYYPVYADIVSLFRVQAGHVQGWGGQDLRMLDHFFMGPNLDPRLCAQRHRPARPDARHQQRRAGRHELLGCDRWSCRARSRAYRRISG